MHATAEPFVLLGIGAQRMGRNLSLTTAGCLSLIGLNDAGIAIGNNNDPTDRARGGLSGDDPPRPGARTWSEAVRAITTAPRASGQTTTWPTPRAGCATWNNRPAA